MTDDIVIRVENVSKDFVLPHEKANSIKNLFTGSAKRKGKRGKETQHALRDISFEVKKGEFFGIVGRNGSGKSTLLKILAGIYQPTSGNTYTHGKLVPFIELGVGFNPELTGRENVYLNGAMLGFSQKEIRAMYSDIVAFAELDRFMDQKLKNYSSGMQVRLAFSMATRSEADILLVDEVLAVGDADFQRKCFEYFRKLKKDQKTVVFVSHDMSAIREYCDRAILIDKSKLVIGADSEQVAKEYLRLFSEPLINESDNTAKWGTGGVDIQKVTTSETIYTDDDDEIEIHVTVKAIKEFDGGFVPGITIKNESGQAICGTNSKIIRADNLELAKGETKTVIWSIPNIFNEGQFIIEPAVSLASNLQVCQWWNDAKMFRVMNKQKTPYPIAPKVTLRVSSKTP